MIYLYDQLLCIESTLFEYLKGKQMLVHISLCADLSLQYIFMANEKSMMRQLLPHPLSDPFVIKSISAPDKRTDGS